MTTATQPDHESRITALEQKVADLQQQLNHERMMAGIKRGLDEADRGLGKPAAEVLERLRVKHNIPAA